jgi:glycosyltransferase involved in cell wall biosynthesis
MARDTHMHVAIVHDYLTQRGGAERVLLSMAKAFPDAPIYTSLYHPIDTFPEFADLDVRPTWLNRIGPIRRHHRLALPLLPWVMSRLKIDASLVLVSSSGWAHGVQSTGSKLVYCYSPARWLYQRRRYLGDHQSFGTTLALRILGPWLRRWDLKSAQSADAYLTLSSLVQDRIYEAYGLASTLVPAPRPHTEEAVPTALPDVEAWLRGRPFELCVSRLLPYKNVRAIVAAYSAEPNRRLIIVGRGPEKPHLQAAAGENVLFLEDLLDGELAWLYRRATALLAVSYEDFGLTPLEAAAFGKPSVLLRWGGYLETMVEDVTAVFVEAPEPEQIRSALGRLDAIEWDPERITEHAGRYHEDLFIERLRDMVKQQLEDDAPIR